MARIASSKHSLAPRLEGFLLLPLFLVSVRTPIRRMEGSCSAPCCALHRPPWLLQPSPTALDEACDASYEEFEVCSYKVDEGPPANFVAAGEASDTSSDVDRESASVVSTRAATFIAAGIRGFLCRQALKWFLLRHYHVSTPVSNFPRPVSHEGVSRTRECLARGRFQT